MAHLPRYVLLGQPQHVIQRGNNRGVTFFGRKEQWYAAPANRPATGRG